MIARAPTSPVSDRARRRVPAGGADSALAAFTLIEMLVVAVIISILASAIIPRMLNVGQRQAEQEARAVQRLLSVAAEKADVWNQPVAIEYSDEKSTFTVWSEREDSKTTPDSVGAARVRWQPDPLVEPVALVRLKVAQTLQDAQSLSSSKWRVAFSPGQPRPALSIQLEPKSEMDGPRWTVALPVGQTVASRAVTTDARHGAGEIGLGASPRSIDLDDAGRGQTPW